MMPAVFTIRTTLFPESVDIDVACGIDRIPMGIIQLRAGCRAVVPAIACGAVARQR